MDRQALIGAIFTYTATSESAAVWLKQSDGWEKSGHDDLSKWAFEQFLARRRDADAILDAIASGDLSSLERIAAK